MDSQNSQIRLPLMKPKDRIMSRAQTMGHPFSACGLMEEAAQRSPIHRRSRVDPKPNNPTCALVHHDEDPMSFESKGLTPKEIDAPETVFRMPDERKP